MKMQLLIANILFLFYSCSGSLKESLPLNEKDDYKLISYKYINSEINDVGTFNLIKRIKESKNIKGPIVGAIVKQLKILNTSKKDTILITVYGFDNKLFKIENKCFSSNVSILPDSTKSLTIQRFNQIQ